MEEKKVRIGIGTFDYLKGIAILTVIFGHCHSSFDFSTLPKFQIVLDCYLYPLFSGLFRCFFIISGFYFREKSIKETLRSESKQVLKPYLLVFAFSVLIHALVELSLGQYRVQGSFEMLLACVFGFWESGSLFGLEISAVGPVWFLLADFWCILFLDVVIREIPEKWQFPAVIVLFFTGLCLYGLMIQLPFCIREGLIYLPYCYYGYMLRKKKWIQKISGRWAWIAFGAVLFVTLLFRIFFHAGEIVGQQALMAVWALILFPAAALWRPKNGLITNVVSFFGRYSLFVFCAHSVEKLGFSSLRHSFVGQYREKPLLGLTLLFLIRSAIAAAGCGLVVLWGKLFKRRCGN